MDLVVTEQVEDPHVVYAVGDAEVDKRSWSAAGKGNCWFQLSIDILCLAPLWV